MQRRPINDAAADTAYWPRPVTHAEGRGVRFGKVKAEDVADGRGLRPEHLGIVSESPRPVRPSGARGHGAARIAAAGNLFRETGEQDRHAGNIAVVPAPPDCRTPA